MSKCGSILGEEFITKILNFFKGNNFFLLFKYHMLYDNDIQNDKFAVVRSQTLAFSHINLLAAEKRTSEFEIRGTSSFSEHRNISKIKRLLFL